MSQNDIKQLIYFFTHNKHLTKQQIAVRDRLITRDCHESEQKKQIIKDLSPESTTQFLSKFNESASFKYLTHEFDPIIPEGAASTLPELYKQSLLALNSAPYIPRSLWLLMNGFITGSTWLDMYGQEHYSSISNKAWVDWSKHNGNKHPRLNPEFEPEIKAFASTVRLRAPQLLDICEKLSIEKNIKPVFEKLERADIPTNTLCLYSSISRILSMMKNRIAMYPEIKISYERKVTSDKRIMGILSISQKGAIPSLSIRDIKAKWDVESQAGDLGSIKNMMEGYCYWSIEANWLTENNETAQPTRWNILRRPDTPEIEKLTEPPVGFSHIFTFNLI